MNFWRDTDGQTIGAVTAGPARLLSYTEVGPETHAEETLQK
jgi:hypothetical protein